LIEGVGVLSRSFSPFAGVDGVTLSGSAEDMLQA
jgi:hypothetical protein